MIPILLSICFYGLSAIHVYWGFGGKWGVDAVIPKMDKGTEAMIPGAMATFLVAFGLFSLGIFVCIKASWLQIFTPDFVLDYGLVAIGVVFGIRSVGEFKYVGFFKKVKDTKFAYYDTRLFSPLCLVISILSFAWWFI